MTITSLNSQKKGSKWFLYLIAAIGVGLIAYFGKDLIRNIGNINGKTEIKVNSNGEEAQVYMDSNLLTEKTPYESKTIRPGEHKIQLKTASRQYETTIDFLPNTQVVVSRDLGVSDIFSSGQNFWIEKTDSQTVLSVISEPSDASVFIDNTEVGKTPFSTSTITPGEYDFRVEMTGYEAQSARIKIQKGYNLNSALKLFPIPVPSKVTAFEGSTNLYDLSSSNTLVTSDVQNWAKSISYWNKTRGINIADLGINKESIFSFFVDYKGDVYTKDGVKVSLPSGSEELKDLSKGGYLGRTADGAGLTQQAKDAYLALSAQGGGKKATIKDTGIGWLRVRETAGLGGVEIAKVNVGTTYDVLEEQTEWVKIKVSETVQGWVSKTYVDIAE